jgi:hypothetical protein
MDRTTNCARGHTMKNLKQYYAIAILALVYSSTTFAGGEAEMAGFYEVPDGVKVIYGYNSARNGHLYRVSTNLYVQTKSDAYLADMKLLIRKLKISRSGREILRQVGTYTPVNAPADIVGPLIEHTEGVNTSKVTVVTVIREPEKTGRLFETVPSEFDNAEKASLVLQRQFNGKGLSNTVYFSTTELVNIPGTSQPFDQAVALGHELIHARDYASGAMPAGNVHLTHRHPESQEVTEYVIANAEYQTTGIGHYNNAANGRAAETEINNIRQQMINRREDMYFQWKQFGQEKPKAYLSNEQVVSEYHLADDLGAPKRNTYWPADQYQYHPYTVDVRPASSVASAPHWDTVEGKQAHIEVKRALRQSLNEGKQPAIVVIDATEQRLSQSLQSNPVLAKRGLGNQNSILKYAAQNDIKVVNVYSGQNETPISSLKKRKKSLLYRAISGQSSSSSEGYVDVQYNESNQELLNHALADNDEVLVMAYSDGKITTSVIDHLSQNQGKQVMVSRYANLDYQPTNLSAEESLSWLNMRDNDNVKMLGAGSQPSFNMCSVL